jgi:hypothetical protein
MKFGCLKGRLVNLKKHPNDFFQNNILLESFLLHTRAIISFLFDNKKQDDVVANEFCDNGIAWRRDQKSLCPYLHSKRKEINKFLAHISYRRLGKYDGWNITVIESEIFTAWSDFKKHLPEERRDWFCYMPPPIISCEILQNFHSMATIGTLKTLDHR